MKNILNSTLFIFSILVFSGCDGDIQKFVFNHYDVKFRSFDIVEDRERNGMSDIPESEYFLTDSIRGLDIIVLQGTGSYFEEFMRIGSHHHELCDRSDLSYPENYFRLYRNTYFSKGILSSNEVMYFEVLEGYRIRVTKSLATKYGAISVISYSNTSATSVDEIMTFAKEISDNILIDPTTDLGKTAVSTGK